MLAREVAALSNGEHEGIPMAAAPPERRPPVLTGVSSDYEAYALQTRPDYLPGGVYVAWLGNWLWIPPVALIGTFVVLLFPNGRLPSRRWRVVAWLSAAVLISTSVSTALSPGRLDESPNVTNPLGIESAGSILGLVKVG